MLDEWPDTEIVAVLVDAAIREDGVRTDVLDLKIEHRLGERAASLYQRYSSRRRRRARAGRASHR